MASNRRSSRTQAILAGVVVTLVLWFAGLILLDLLFDSVSSPGAVSLLQLLYDIGLPVGVTAVAWLGMRSTWELSAGVPDDLDDDEETGDDGVAADDDVNETVAPLFDGAASDRRVLIVAPMLALLANRVVWERVDDQYAPLSLWLTGDRDIALFLVEAVLALVVVGVSIWAGLAARTLLVR